MNKIVVGVLGFVVGAAAGGTGVYLYCRQATEKIVEEECGKVRDYYKRKTEESKGEDKGDLPGEIDSSLYEVDKPAKFDGRRAVDPEDMYDYGSCFVGTGDGESVAETSAKNSKKSVKKGSKSVKNAENEAKLVENGLKLEKIRQIGDEEWSDWDGYESKVLSYFEDEEVFLDENYEEVIGAIDSVGGIDMLDGTIGSDGCIYIKNENEHCKYEIIVETVSYAEYRRRYGLDEE